MGVYIEYCKSLKIWHDFGSMGHGFFDTEEEARAVYGKLLTAFDRRRIK